MKEIDKSKPVLVTGGTGYLASWIIKQLLEKGIPVHATVRDIHNKKKIAFLLDIAEKANGQLKLFEADLLKDRSFDQSMIGCELVIHTASPFFVSKIKDPKRELIEPAEKGTKNVLNSANKSKSVRRVVLTSSVAAIYGDAKDAEDIPSRTFDETYWNTTSNEKHQPYSYSKTLAEKKAWELAGLQDKWDLVVINPAFIIGPSLNASSKGTSNTVIIQLGNGDMKMGAPDFWYGLVDVRDVAKAHILAGFQQEASGRHILCYEYGGFLQLADLLRDKYQGKYPLPRKLMPKALFWLVGPAFGIKRKMISKNVGFRYTLDNSYSISDLGMEYTPLEKTIHDHFEQIIRDGLL